MSELLGYSILAFGAGLLLNFVPCMLPIIPVKIYTVLRELERDIRSRILAAVSLLAGTMSFFLILGGATAYLELAWGDFFRSKLFLAGLTAFFLFAGIATFANWSVRLPLLIYRVPIYRYSGAFFTGALAGILSTPCSGPFLGSVLAYSLTQSAGVIILIFIWIGVGLALPYIVFLLWPGLMKRLPFLGPWTVWIKQLLGFVLIEFTAKWCLNCEVLKKTTYEDKSVVRAASKAMLIPLRVDMTDFNESHKLLLGKYGGTALPFAVLISSDGKVAQRFQGMF